MDTVTPKKSCLLFLFLLSLSSLLGLIVVIIRVRPIVAIDHLFNNVNFVDFVFWFAKMTSFLNLALLCLPFYSLNVVLSAIIIIKQGCVFGLKRCAQKSFR